LTRTITSSREDESINAALQRSTAVIESVMTRHILTVNAFFLGGMHYKLEQIKGKHYKIFCIKEESNSANYIAFWKFLSEGQFVVDRIRRIDSRSNIVWLEASYNPISDVHGRLYKVVKFSTIITGQINCELAVSEAADIAFSTSKQTDNSAKKGSQVVSDTATVMRQLSD
jgi:methyl-accepting chemotaxis protein